MQFIKLLGIWLFKQPHKRKLSYIFSLFEDIPISVLQENLFYV